MEGKKVVALKQFKRGSRLIKAQMQAMQKRRRKARKLGRT
jgi:exonuclease VII small subunit